VRQPSRSYSRKPRAHCPASCGLSRMRGSRSVILDGSEPTTCNPAKVPQT
jgi:hypothetical protein